VIFQYLAEGDKIMFILFPHLMFSP